MHKSKSLGSAWHVLNVVFPEATFLQHPGSKNGRGRERPHLNFSTRSRFSKQSSLETKGIFCTAKTKDNTPSPADSQSLQVHPTLSGQVLELPDGQSLACYQS